MRIVIDLQSCQDGSSPGALALAQELVHSAGEHEVWIALSDRHLAGVDALRRAFTPPLPPGRVRVFDLPWPASGGDAHWSARAAELVRDNFLASLEPDAVFLPYPFGGAGAVCGPPGPSAPFALVWGDAHGDSAPAVWRRIKAAVGERTRAAAVRAAAVCAAALPQRARLAYVSPLPPEKSGIADYSAELLPQLARFYDVELIVAGDRTGDAPPAPGFPIHGPAWFAQHAHEFERVLYHFGNSPAHQHMFDMIRRHPGIVVLHDFFFSGVLGNLEPEGTLAHPFVQALAESHGYSGLLDEQRGGRESAIWKYPVNKGVLDNASGVIVHSELSCQLARHWYGPDAASGWRIVPLLRGRPDAGDAPGAARAAARARLKLEADDFLVCSFGMLGRTKLNAELLDAFVASKLGADPRCKLLFVGENEGGLYGAALRNKIEKSVAAARIGITGFVKAPTYADYLAACDCAVQLRSATRGETSAAVLDCLLYGVPAIVNAHGACAAMSEALLHKLPDRFSGAELRAALEQLHGDAGLRAALSRQALAYMRAEHAPQRVGQVYRDAIEHFTLHSPRSHYRTLLGALAQLARVPGMGAPSTAQLATLARAVASNQPPLAPRQLLVDVSALAQSDHKTGIQRVVRSVLLALVEDPPPGYRIEPVASTGANRSYSYARRFTLGMLGIGAAGDGAMPDEAPAELRPGDVFLGLDLFTNGTAQNAALLQSMHAHGVAIYFVVFDILPMQLPGMFPFGTAHYFGDFLRTVTRVSDGVLCISRAVADQLIDWTASEHIARAAPLKVGYFHLGADIDASAPTSGLPANAAPILEAMRAHPSFLMVGTVEPRKGHAQALAAFEQLWAQGMQVNLVVAGKQGWMVDKLAERMAQHPQRERRLFWLAGVSDEMLTKLYAGAAALLAPSLGEGFGLPLIEAAQHRLPIIARNLPVFREVAGQHAYYFEGLDAADLAAAIQAWLGLWREGKAPASSGMPWLTWREAAQQVLGAILRQQWYRELPPAM